MRLNGEICNISGKIFTHDIQTSLGVETLQATWSRAEEGEMLAVIEVDRDMKVMERVEEVRVETMRGESGVMEWNMIIDDVSPSDAGLYQCQVKYIS